MTDKELMQSAMYEIRELRKQNQEMRLRLSMFDDLMTVLHSKPHAPSQGYSEDIAWKLEKRISSELPTP